MKHKNLVLLSAIMFSIYLTGLQAQTVKDIDGNIYHTVTIGSQVWMVENLMTTKYRNGDKIPLYTSSILNSKDDSGGSMEISDGCCNYKDSIGNAKRYGLFYNYMCVSDERNIAPKGWHVPSQTDWNTLIEYLGGAEVAGGKLKEKGNEHWKTIDNSATNETGFTAIPCGEAEYFMGYFWFDTGDIASWWSSEEFPSSGDEPQSFWANHIRGVDGGMISSTHGFDKFYSVRCIKDK
jgi:uncharacterized protein (TIGR02145 family)